jgi:hypothetical protein
VTRERGGPNACPLRCRRQRSADDPASTGAAGDQVDWAGLPVNLDLVFSQQQREKVYGQYLKRRRGTELWGWSENGGPPCACELSGDDGRSSPDAAESMSSR